MSPGWLLGKHRPCSASLSYKTPHGVFCCAVMNGCVGCVRRQLSYHGRTCSIWTGRCSTHFDFPFTGKGVHRLVTNSPWICFGLRGFERPLWLRQSAPLREEVWPENTAFLCIVLFKTWPRHTHIGASGGISSKSCLIPLYKTTFYILYCNIKYNPIFCIDSGQHRILPLAYMYIHHR